MELLIVLAVVALMAAILFLVLSQARDKGRQTVCLSNERQLGIAFLMYARDNDGFLTLDSHGWAGAIYPDVRNIGVFACPSDATTAQPPYYPVSYSVNANLWHVIPLGTSTAGNGGPLSEIGILMGSSMKFDIDEDVRYATGIMGVSPEEGSVWGKEEPGRHQGGSNFLYADAHVKWLSPQQVSPGADALSPGDEPHHGTDLVPRAAGSENSHFAATFSTE